MFKEPEWIIIKVILDLVGILVRADSYFELWWGFYSIPGQWFGTFLPQSSKLESWWSWNWKNISMSVNSLKRCQMFWVHLETIKNIPFRFNFQLALKWKEPIPQQQMFDVHILIITCWQWAGSDWWKWWLNTKLGWPNSRWGFSDLNITDICSFLLVYTSHWHSSSSSLPGLPCTPNSVRFKISLQRVVKGPNLDQNGKIFLWLFHQVKVYIGQIIVISTFLPVDNSLLGVLDTRKTNTKSGKLYYQ